MAPLALVLVGPAFCALADDAPVSRTVIGGPSPHLLAAADALRAGDAEEAIRASLLGLEEHLSPRDRASALSNLCGAYTLARQLALAIARCTDAIALRPRWQSYHNRALAYLHDGQLELAERDIDAGLELNPDSKLLGQARAALESLRRERDRRPPPTVTAWAGAGEESRAD